MWEPWVTFWELGQGQEQGALGSCGSGEVSRAGFRKLIWSHGCWVWVWQGVREEEVDGVRWNLLGEGTVSFFCSVP